MNYNRQNCKIYAFAILLLLQIFFIAPRAGADTYAKNPINGFRGIYFGDTIKEHKSVLIPITNNSINSVLQKGTNYIFTRVGDSPEIGGAYIGTFEYFFDENGFWQVSSGMYYDSDFKTHAYGQPKTYNDIESRMTKIYEACAEQWGEPKKNTRNDSKGDITVSYSWYYPYAGEDLAYATLIWNHSETKNKALVLFSIKTFSGLDRQDERMRNRNKKIHQGF